MSTRAPITIDLRQTRSTRQVPDSIIDLERLTDRWIQVGPLSFGLDGVLGLIPGFGDLASGLISAYIIARASRDGVPRAALARMMSNVAIDTMIGMIPFAGDLFDFLFKANTKNLQIYREALAGPRDARRDWTYVAVFLICVLAVVAIPVVLGVMLLMRVLHGS
jgi:hypothetical protein